MQFTKDDLRKFADWECVAPSHDVINRHLLPLVREITASNKIIAHIFEHGDGGLSNYVALFLHQTPGAHPLLHGRDSAPSEVPGVTVFLSLLAPVGVFGRKTSVLGSSFVAWGYLEPKDVVNPDERIGDIEETLVRATAKTPYSYLSREDISAPLPHDITPYEYCIGEQPWDRVFHVMFANTD